MPSISADRFRFALLIALPAMLAIVVVSSVVASIMAGMADSANGLNELHLRRTAQAALQSILEDTGKYAEDNAHWDDAVRNGYGAVDGDWFAETWGAGTASTVYDYAFLIDADGKRLAGHGPDLAEAATAGDILGADLEPIIGLLPKDGRRFDRASRFFRNADTLLAATVAPIVPVSEDLAIPQAVPNFLVFAKILDAPLAARLSQTFIIDGLTIGTAAAGADQSLDIRDHAGEAIGRLAWRDAKPGDVARRNVEARAYFAVLTLVAVMGLFAMVFWRNLRDSQTRAGEAMHASLHDELSGLPNRRHLKQLLAEALAAPRRPGNDLALIYADLDRFKDVNDAFGHEVGDQLIRAVAAGFAQLAGGDGTLARLGGDEFAIIVRHPTAAQRACDLAEMMIHLLSSPFDFDGRVVSVGTSIGMVVPAIEDTDAEEILRRADVAMYRAKAGGRNRLCVYEPVMDFERRQRRLMASDLRQAIEARQLDVVYQPYVDAATRRIVGAEALLRWNRKGFEPVSPVVFIPIAEENGLIDDIGRYVLEAACRQARKWPSIRMSVNVSPAQFRNPLFLSTVQRQIVAGGIDPTQLDLEVTESYLIDEPDRAEQMINGLHKLGVSVSIDDFGTGYSSIGYLRKFNFSKLKIDRSLISGILTNEASQRIVQGTVLIADALSLKVTAEGVETEDESTLLRLAGCSEFQGFLFHRPMTPDKVTALLREEQGTVTRYGAAA